MAPEGGKMIAILVITICILAVYAVFMTAVANVRGSEIELRKKSFDSLARSIDVRGREITEAHSRIDELESAANAAAKSLLECFACDRNK